MAPYWQRLVAEVGEAKGARIGDPSAPYLRHGRFEIDKMIGCGGMGIVFKARDPELDRDVALKLWNLAGDDAEAALVNEAQCQAKVAHPNVVTIYETGKIGADVFLAMEYVQGSDGRRWMNKRRGSWQQALALFICAGQGLAAVHARGLLHADFKPENLLVGDDGRVLVADFGVARALRAGDGGVDKEGSAGLGTKVYMAPERLERRGGDARSDQFSFCVSLWECMYGVRPFSGETREELLASMRAGELRTGAELRGVPPRLRRILVTGLAINPARRFASVEALLKALRDVPVRRGRRVRGAAGVVGLLAAGMVGMILGGGANRVGERPRLGSVIPHVPDGITSQLRSTNQAGQALPSDAEILERIADGAFQEALTAWRHRRHALWTIGRSSEDLSLKVAAAYLEQAESLEPTDPATALMLARYADQVATSVPADFGATQVGTALADEIATQAMLLVTRLNQNSVPVLD